jgi:peptidoglycan/xylan/chitin deacetylase (PgdA/CDA1 family)
MKVVMYHYVRPTTELLHFAYLQLDNFRKQLDWFAAKWGFVERDSFSSWLEGGDVPPGILLTFDDGLRDHIEFVLPILREKGLFAIFYVSTAPFETGAVLDVHKVHLALGRLGGPASAAWLEAHAPGSWSSVTSQGSAFAHYAAQSSDEATKQVKQFFNWWLKPQERRPLLDGLLEHAFGGAPPGSCDVYLDRAGLRILADNGMGIGPHGHNHIVLSSLQAEAQMNEIQTSCDFIEALGGSHHWGFCYPYGSPSAFDDRTEKIVAEVGCPFAFAVEHCDIDLPLRATRRFALPRHNCNSFPHGAASFGVTGKRELTG